MIQKKSPEKRPRRPTECVRANWFDGLPNWLLSYSLLPPPRRLAKGNPGEPRRSNTDWTHPGYESRVRSPWTIGILAGRRAFVERRPYGTPLNCWFRLPHAESAGLISAAPTARATGCCRLGVSFTQFFPTQALFCQAFLLRPILRVTNQISFSTYPSAKPGDTYFVASASRRRARLRTRSMTSGSSIKRVRMA